MTEENITYRHAEKISFFSMVRPAPTRADIQYQTKTPAIVRIESSLVTSKCFFFQRMVNDLDQR